MLRCMLRCFHEQVRVSYSTCHGACYSTCYSACCSACHSTCCGTFHEQSGALTLGTDDARLRWVYRAVAEALTPEGVAICSLLTLKQARPAVAVVVSSKK